MKLRKSVKWFAFEMEKKLRENDHKGGWNNESCNISYLLKRLKQEIREIDFGGDEQEVIRECADVANFAMMIADKLGKSIGQ